ncbi:MAG: hypothetical protein P0Y60_17905 [Candidatus Microbacterium colombiense]|nr:MAG: hypothetical protein P0Y60_17905 [Microbacterium sp.]
MQSEAEHLTTADVSGTWDLEGADKGATLSMSDDGAFLAESWPANLLCAPTGAATIDDLAWDDPVTVSGTWQVGKQATSLLILMPDGEICKATWALKVWEFGEGEYRIELILDGVANPEDAKDDQVAWITKRGAE